MNKTEFFIVVEKKFEEVKEKWDYTNPGVPFTREAFASDYSDFICEMWLKVGATDDFEGHNSEQYTKEQIAELKKNYLDDGDIKIKVPDTTFHIDKNYNPKPEKPITKELLKKLYKKCKETAIPKIEINGRMVYVWLGRVGFADNFMYKKFLNKQNKEKQMKSNIGIAQIAHEANRTYCESIGDNSQSTWEDAPANIKKSAIDGVQKVIANPKMTAKNAHDSWLKFKEEDGWKYGEEKDADKKTHPCMVPFNKLPKEQQYKDKLFIKTVKAEMKK